MAELNIETKTKTIEVMVKKEINIDSYSLSLSREELIALHALLNNVCGDKQTSIRYYLGRINQTLEKHVHNMPTCWDLFHNVACKAHTLANFNSRLTNVVIK